MKITTRSRPGREAHYKLAELPLMSMLYCSDQLHPPPPSLDPPLTPFSIAPHRLTLTVVKS